MECSCKQRMTSCTQPLSNPRVPSSSLGVPAILPSLCPSGTYLPFEIASNDFSPYDIILSPQNTLRTLENGGENYLAPEHKGEIAARERLEPEGSPNPRHGLADVQNGVTARRDGHLSSPESGAENANSPVEQHSAPLIASLPQEGAAGRSGAGFSSFLLILPPNTFPRNEDL